MVIIPVGAIWQAVAKNGTIAKYWLSERFPNGRQVWKWSVVYMDGSGRDFDWCPSRGGVMQELGWKKLKYEPEQNWPRFKRVNP